VKKGGEREAHVPVRGGIQVGIPCGQVVGRRIGVWTTHNSIFCGGCGRGGGGIHFLARSFGTEVAVISRFVTRCSGSGCDPSTVRRRHAVHGFNLCRLLLTTQIKGIFENAVLRAVVKEN
jgi:hypothetical protein